MNKLPRDSRPAHPGPELNGVLRSGQIQAPSRDVRRLVETLRMPNLTEQERSSLIDRLKELDLSGSYLDADLVSEAKKFLR